MGREAEAHECVYKLADHLDAILAATEDLARTARGGAQAEELLSIELAMITHALQARQSVYEVLACDTRLNHYVVQFVAGTQLLATGDCEAVYIQNTRSISDNYLVGKKMPLGQLADHAAKMLDALERFYVLYDTTNEIEQPAQLSSLTRKGVRFERRAA